MKLGRAVILSLFIAAVLPVAPASALRLDVWNVDELAASDDYVDLQFGSTGRATTLTLQWVGGGADTVGALGIDKLFINDSSGSLSVVSVFTNTIAAANDVTSAWLPTHGGTNAGGGFGRFVEKVTDSASRGGVGGNALVFVLDGLYAPSSFTSNANGASFAVHARYANGCSGWAADGGRPGNSGSDSSCGGTSAVPEPSAAMVFGLGAVIVGGALRRRR